LTASCGCVREAPPKDLTLRSGRECAATLAAPTGNDRTSGTGAHPQAEAMYTGSAPVIRLEGPLALGHDVLLVVLPSGRSDVSHRARLRFDRRWSWCCWPARSPGGSGRSRIADFRATVRGYLRGFAWSNLACRNEAARPCQKDFRFDHTRRRPGYHNEPKQARSTLNRPIGLQQNGWQPDGKLLASAKSI
jgi:hypothetical protein